MRTAKWRRESSRSLSERLLWQEEAVWHIDLVIAEIELSLGGITTGTYRFLVNREIDPRAMGSSFSAMLSERVEIPEWNQVQPRMEGIISHSTFSREFPKCASMDVDVMVCLWRL